MTGFGAGLRGLWRFGAGVTYLNHGGFGATPSEVLDAQACWRDRIEAAPGPFFAHDYPALIREAAAAVAGWLGADAGDVAFVDNATTAVNAVVRSFPLAAGDEVLVTSTTYGACRNAAGHAAAARGARLSEAVLPFPAGSPEGLAAAVEAAVTPRTRLALIDHVVSETGYVLPVAAIAARLRARGVAVLVDGAHAPGQVPVDLPATGADWYAANLHKWAFAPRGCGILWARPDRQEGLHPPVISWGLGQGFTAEFDWVGTRDPTPWLAAPAGIALLARLGEAAARGYRDGLARDGAAELARAWGTDQATPDALAAAMRLVALPGSGQAATRADADAVRRALWEGDRIEAPVMPLAGRLWVRVSAQVYNEIGDFRRLAAAVERLPAGLRPA